MEIRNSGAVTLKSSVECTVSQIRKVGLNSCVIRLYYLGEGDGIHT